MRKRLLSFVALVVLVTGAVAASIAAPVSAGAAGCTATGGLFGVDVTQKVSSVLVYDLIGFEGLSGCEGAVMQLEAIPTIGSVGTPGTCTIPVPSLPGDQGVGCASLLGIAGAGVGTFSVIVEVQVVAIGPGGNLVTRIGSCTFTLSALGQAPRCPI